MPLELIATEAAFFQGTHDNISMKECNSECTRIRCRVQRLEENWSHTATNLLGGHLVSATGFTVSLEECCEKNYRVI